MSEHTPGPWKWAPCEYAPMWDETRLVDANGTEVLGGSAETDNCGVYGSPSNKALIAAAPDLLAACKEAVPEIRCLWHQLTRQPTNQITGETRNILDRISAAIAKAEGC